MNYFDEVSALELKILEEAKVVATIYGHPFTATMQIIILNAIRRVNYECCNEMCDKA